MHGGSARELLCLLHMPTPIDRMAAFQELRDLVTTYLEGSEDAERAATLLAAIEPSPLMAVQTMANEPISAREDRERSMFGCTAAAIDAALAKKPPRDVAMYAMGTLSNAQES